MVLPLMVGIAITVILGPLIYLEAKREMKRRLTDLDDFVLRILRSLEDHNSKGITPTDLHRLISKSPMSKDISQEALSKSITRLISRKQIRSDHDRLFSS